MTKVKSSEQQDQEQEQRWQQRSNNGAMTKRSGALKYVLQYSRAPNIRTLVLFCKYGKGQEQEQEQQGATATAQSRPRASAAGARAARVVMAT
jgi:hypothetical protein